MKPVNVSSVAQLSPFRYPGGKTWLIPYYRRWISTQDRPRLLVEPFAGGGIVSLTTAFEDLADRVLMVELDENVAAVWKTILGRNSAWLADQILNFEMSVENLNAALNNKVSSVRQRALVTILRNRTSHGGILAAGSGYTRRGENGKGIASRWYANTLAKRIKAIHERRDRITFVQSDGLDVMSRHLSNSTTAFFVDPPYTASAKNAGRRLYDHCELDHQELFELAAAAQGETLMTYDDDEGVKQMARRNGLAFVLVPMQSRRLTRMYELLISRETSWMK